MTIVLADADRQALAAAEQCARSVFPFARVVPCTDAMSAFKYCMNHREAVDLVLLSVILRPVDGLELSTMLLRLPIAGQIALLCLDDSRDLRYLLDAKGSIWQIVKPVTPEKLLETLQSMAEGRAEEGDEPLLPHGPAQDEAPD